MKRLMRITAGSLVLLTVLVVSARAATTQLYDGDARYYDDPPDIVAYANTAYITPPAGVTITDGGGLWRYKQWIALMEKDDWIQATYSITDTTEVGVQFYGDSNDGWARVLVDGSEVWTGDTYAPTAIGYIKYLKISGLSPGTHTIRVENMGITGTGSQGDDVAVFFFGFESPASPTPPMNNGFTFYAVYDRLASKEELGNARITNADISGDGQKVIFSAWNDDTDTPYLYMINSDGTNLTQITLPDLEERWIDEVVIDRDGSRAFFIPERIPTCTYESVFKVEGGVVTEVFDADDYADVNCVEEIRTTADGEYVYFMEDRDDIWRFGHNGGGLTRIINDAAVPTNLGQGWMINDFDISDSGNNIAFKLYGYSAGRATPRNEVFAYNGGAIVQLTTDGTTKADVEISGDGSTVTYSGYPTRYSIQSNGLNRVAMEHQGFNFGGSDLTRDGELFFYYDQDANGGRLTNTDGSGRLDIFPGWNGADITLAAIYNTRISDDGRKVLFIFSEDVYVGHLNDPDAVPSAPTIHNIAFDPAAMPRGNPDARVILTSQISDPQGRADITRTSTDHLKDGVLEGDTWGKLPAYFYFSARDEGNPPDQVANDGVFTSSGQPGSKIDELDQVTVRMSAKDGTDSVVVADTILFIGSVQQMPLFAPTNLKAEPGAASIKLTWDPSTSPDLLGNNVYRSTAADGPWTKINAALVTGDTYLDTASLTPGTTYYYYVTAVNGASLQTLSPAAESDPSNIAYAVFGTLKFFIPDSFGANGESIILPVNLANANGVEMCAVDIYVTYDAAVLTATGIEKTALTASYNWASNTTVPGVVKASIAAALGDTLYGEGSLFNVLFDVVGAAEDTSELAFQVTGTAFYDCGDLVNPVPLDLTDVGIFTVEASHVLGDLDGDGVVTNADADLALEIAVGNLIPTPEQEAAGDINGDGRINSADAALILRIAAGMPLAPTAAEALSMEVAQPSAVTLSAPDDASVPEGGSAWVAVSISDATNLAGADIVLNYNPFVATAIDARTTTLSANFEVELNVPVAGQARISLKPKPGYEAGLDGGSGALFELKFEAPDTAAVGDTTVLNLASVRLNDSYGRDFGTSALQVDVSGENGLLTVWSYKIYLPLVVR